MKCTCLNSLTLLILLWGAISPSNAQKARPTFRPDLEALPELIKEYTSVDQVLYVITYNFTAFHFPKDHVFRSGINHDEAKKKYRYNDIQVLEIGKNMSKMYSRLIYEVDSIVGVQMKENNGRHSFSLEDSIKNLVPIEIYKNYPKGKYTLTDRVIDKDIFLYEEPFPIDFEWKLTNDTKKILSYECQKAVTDFRGRRYEAWFTSAIPINEGPYKFCGLPGLILELRDSDDHYVYNCIGIRECKVETPIKFWEWNYKRMSRKKYNKNKEYINKNYYLIKAAENKGKQQLGYLILPSGETVKMMPSKNIKKPAFSHNPIELED